MFTAGSDRHLRYWSFANPEQCSCTLLPPLATPNQAQTEIFAHRSEEGCAVFSAQPQVDADKGEVSTMQQKYVTRHKKLRTSSWFFELFSQEWWLSMPCVWRAFLRRRCRYRKGLDALAQSSVGELVGVSALCMIGRYCVALL
jgi:hypothetical protein